MGCGIEGGRKGERGREGERREGERGKEGGEGERKGERERENKDLAYFSYLDPCDCHLQSKG